MKTVSQERLWGNCFKIGFDLKTGCSLNGGQTGFQKLINEFDFGNKVSEERDFSALCRLQGKGGRACSLAAGQNLFLLVGCIRL